MADPKVFANPGNVQPQIDTAQPVSDSAIAQSNPIGAGKLPQVNPDDQARAGLTERGAPRDLDTWANQHGEMNEFVNDQAMWDEEAFNSRKYQQSKMRTVAAPTAATHHIVQAPDGAKVAFPKGTSTETMYQEMEKWWAPRIQQAQSAWDSVRHAASNAAQAIGLPSDMPEWQKASDEFVRDPIGTTGDVVGAIVGGLAHGANAVIPNTLENKAMVERAHAEWKQGNHLAAATTLTPLVGDGLAKAVKQAQSRDYSGSIGTSLGVAAPFLTGAHGEGEFPRSVEEAYAGEERRAGARPALMSPTEIETAMKNRRLQDIKTPFDSTEGASATMNRDIAARLAEKPTPQPVAVNGSGESSASQEAINRVASQKAQGVKTYRVDSRSGNTIPVLGVDAADATAKPYEHIVQVKDGQATIQDSGRGARPLDEAKLLKQVTPVDADAEALKKALSGSAGANALYAKAKAELGPDATSSEVAQRVQAMKTGTPAPKANAAAAGRSVGAASINDLNTKEDVPTFYSKAEQVINEKVSNNASGDSIKALLKNNGVKDDEMKWAGLDEFLKDKPKVSKADLQQFIKENQIQLKDVDLGTKLPEEQKAALEQELHQQTLRNGDLYKIGDDRTPAEESEYQQGVDRAKEIEKQLDAGQPTQYDKWTVPGERENYREKLLTLPTKESPELQGLRKEYAAAEAARNAYSQTGNVVPGDVELRFQDAQNAMRKMKNEESTSRDYVAPHFGGAGGDQPTNIVAHVRFDDRPAVDGKKTLFMEEAQSDWHSAGRHEGYKASPKEISKADDVVRAAQDALDKHLSEIQARLNQEGQPVDLKGAPQWRKDELMSPEENEQYYTLKRQVESAKSDKAALTQGAVPDAPFKQSWHDLVMKRMLRQAAENGYDRLAWTTGDQQADLYGLEHHFSRLEYDPESGQLEGYDPQGDRVLQENVDPDAKSLAEYMGPELAEKMADKIQDYNDNYPGQPDPYMFYDSVREGYDIEPREVPDEDHEFEPVQEREDFDSYVKELAEKYGFKHPEHVPWNDLSLHMTEEEKAKGESMIKDAEDAEEQQEQDRPTKTEYHVTQNGDDVSGPHDTEEDADEAMRNRIDRDVQYEMEDYKSAKPETPTLSGLDLHNGGEFHKLLYDQMIPSFLKKYAKKWGAEVGTTDIRGMGTPEVDYEGPNKTVQELQDVSDNGGVTGKHPPGYSAMRRLGDVLRAMRSGKPFRDAMLSVVGDTDAEHLAEHLGGKFIKTPANQKVHSIEITPAMRQSVMKEGQPIAKKDEKKKPFAAPQGPQVASNISPTLSEKMKSALA